jgi:hypothetical protein
MKQFLRLWFSVLVLLLLANTALGQWRVLYATFDDDVSGMGNQDPSVGVIHENMFISLVSRFSSVGDNLMNFMIPYVDADSVLGRKYGYGYGTTPLTGIYQYWSDQAFDQVQMLRAYHIKATPDSFIYVANNDIDHNILVFKYANDTITIVPVNGVYPRQATGANGIFGIDVDNNGYVYVCVDTSAGLTADVMVYPPISQWTVGHADLPLTTIDLPDGIYKGVGVSPSGDQVFISDYTNKRVLKFKGSPGTGYTQDTGFEWALGSNDVIPGTPGMRAGPLGLAYLSPNNILAVACDSIYGGTSGENYAYGRIYLVKASTGGLISPDSSISVIDQAAWNFLVTGAYDDADGGLASGYTSTYDVKFDEKGFLYTVSNYAWTVEKWEYVGTLPSFTGVEEIRSTRPGSFALGQNYPNPFNPSTTIEFSVEKQGFVSVKVFNVLGQEVTTLVQESLPAGTYRVRFDAHDLPSGAYIASLRSGELAAQRTMMLVK